MGSRHRSMVKSQSSTRTRSARVAHASQTKERHSAVLGTIARVSAGVLVCLVALAAFLYPAAKDYYVAVREHDKAELAVQLAQQRNAILEQDVAALATPEGIEDRVRSEYGWVKEGENAVTVTGLPENNSGAKRLEELPAVESVTAPDTWYSDTLDRIFFYEG